MAFKILSKMTGLQNIGTDLQIFDKVNLCVTLMPYPKYVYPSNNLEDIKQNHWTVKYWSVTYIHFMRSICAILIQYLKYDSNRLQDIRQNHWIMKFWSQWPTLILRSNIGLYRLTHISKVWCSSNSLQYIRQNQWTMKYRSQWPTFVLRSNIGLYWLINAKYDVHTSNSLQDIRQNQLTTIYRSHLFWGQMSGHTDP